MLGLEGEQAAVGAEDHGTAVRANDERAAIVASLGAGMKLEARPIEAARVAQELVARGAERLLDTGRTGEQALVEGLGEAIGAATESGKREAMTDSMPARWMAWATLPRAFPAAPLFALSHAARSTRRTRPAWGAINRRSCAASTTTGSPPSSSPFIERPNVEPTMAPWQSK